MPTFALASGLTQPDPLRCVVNAGFNLPPTGLAAFPDSGKGAVVSGYAASLSGRLDHLDRPTVRTVASGQYA